MTYDVNFLFLKKSFRHNGSAVFGKMPQMCRGCPDVNKHRVIDAAILRQHRPFMSIKSFVRHSGWQEMVSLCSLIRLIGVCADCDQPVFLCSRSDSRYLGVHVATAGGCSLIIANVRLEETRYIDIEKSISIIDRNFLVLLSTLMCVENVMTLKDKWHVDTKFPLSPRALSIHSNCICLMKLGYGRAVVLARSPTGNYSTAMTLERQM